jgi:hypothetical protein
VESEVLEELFSLSELAADISQSFMDMPFQLYERRSECLSVLRTLNGSFNKLHLPNIMNKQSVAEYCLQTASLIFCTASSSSKLHSMAMKPLSILVIDEAAQLKECESAIPLQLLGLRHAILVGDECQLPAMVESNVCKCYLVTPFFLFLLIFFNIYYVSFHRFLMKLALGEVYLRD